MENVGMRLFHLVKQNDCIGSAPDLLGELPAVVKMCIRDSGRFGSALWWRPLLLR